MMTQRRQKKDDHRANAVRALCAVVFTVSVSAHAGIADDVANKSYGKVSSMTDMIPQVSGQGREDKAGGSKSQSNLGAVMATLAGSAMVAAAVPLLASINPIEVAAGAQLMAKAAQEFAQAAASSKTGSQNEGQQNLLTRVDENAALPASTAVDVQGAITASLQRDPQLATLLQSRGVDSTQFTTKLANGEVPESIRGLIGTSNATATPESQARVDQLVTQLTQSSFQKAMEQAPKNVTVVETASSKAPTASGDSSALTGASVVGSAAAVGANAAGDRSPASSNGGAGLEAQGSKGAAPSAAQAFGGPGQTGAPSADFSLDSLGDEKMALLEAVEKAYPGKGKEILAAQGGVLLERLNAAGVSKPVGRLSLFQLAHRNFRSYREWRLKKKKTTAAAERRGNQVPRQLANAQ